MNKTAVSFLEKRLHERIVSEKDRPCVLAELCAMLNHELSITPTGLIAKVNDKRKQVQTAATKHYVKIMQGVLEAFDIDWESEIIAIQVSSLI